MSAPKQISVFPATSASASNTAQLLAEQYPQIKLRLAARDPSKVASYPNSTTVSTPLDINSASSIQDALEGSDAAYVLNPPFYGQSNPQELSAAFIAQFIQAANASKALKRLVFLSSIGADKVSGTGNIKNVRVVEQALVKSLRSDIEVFTLRAPYFIENTRGVVPLAVNQPHIFPSMLLPLDRKYVMIDSKAIATKAVKYLVNPPKEALVDAERITAVELHTPPQSAQDLAAALSKLSGANVNAVPVPEEKWEETLVGAGLPQPDRDSLVELLKNFTNGHIAFLDQSGIESQKKEGIKVIVEQTDVDVVGAYKVLIDAAQKA